MSAAVGVASRTRFSILGPLEVSEDGSALPLAGGKARALLARLLLDVGQTVSVDAIIDSLWGESVPASAVKMVHVYVAQLRKVLPPDTLRTRPPGYVLEVAPEAVDLVQLARLREEGRAALAAGDPDTATARLAAGLALWRGTALAEFSEPFAAAHGAHLEELRLACREDRIEAELALGRHSDLVGELRVLVAGHRLRERPRLQLMLALYRAGRQAEALEVYHEFRRTLLDELGMEPSAALNALQRKVLRQDRALDLAPPSPAVEAPPPVVEQDAFVGRAAELARLEDALASALQGRGTTALIAGPAGIGKSQLASELARRARSRGATVLRGGCIDLVGAGLPYLPLVEALKPLCSSGRMDAMRDSLDELPRLHPDLADGAPLTPRGDGAETRLRLFLELVAVLDEVSPVVLVLEDLHWADGSTLDLIAYLAHAIRDRRILVVGTYRTDEPSDPGASLRRVHAAVTLELAPLPCEDIEAIVAGELARPALPAPAQAGARAAAVLATLCERAGGNPFFAKELAAAAARGEGRLPRALRDLLLAGVARLDATSRSVLRAVAVAGRPVPFRLLAAVMGWPDASLVEALRAAVEGHILVPDEATGSYRFRHALYAEVVYASLLPGEREELHARVARALAANPALSASRAHAAEQAEHWLTAGEPAQALAASLQAARDAVAVSGLSEALHHLGHVLELWDTVPAAEDLAGVALGAVLEWTNELCDVTVDAIGVREARELYPLVVVLESIAVRQSPPLGAAALHAMRDANARMRAASLDPAAASAADDDFHTALTASCPDERLLGALRPVREALLRYEHVYMRDPARVARSVAQHDAIVAALERGDHALAAQRVRDNLTQGLPDLADALERRSE